MNDTAGQIDDIREKIIADPDVILEDHDVMRALIDANSSSIGENIVDLRSIAMERLEARLDRLEDTHRGVIAAAYENLAGTNMIHRAILRLMEPTDFPTFLRDLDGEVSEILRVDVIRLVLESVQPETDDTVSKIGDVLVTTKPGFVDDYLTQGRNTPVRQAVLRQYKPNDQEIYGKAHTWIRSEACLKLDFGPGRLPGMLVMGSEDPHQFKPTQGTDLLTFFSGVFERAMHRWLA